MPPTVPSTLFPQSLIGLHVKLTSLPAVVDAVQGEDTATNVLVGVRGHVAKVFVARLLCIDAILVHTTCCVGEIENSGNLRSIHTIGAINIWCIQKEARDGDNKIATVTSVVASGRRGTHRLQQACHIVCMQIRGQSTGTAACQDNVIRL